MARRTKEDAMKTRSDILESALDIFCEKNYSTVTITEIAARVGMTKGAVYWHFKSKNDILIQLISELNNQILRDFLDKCGTPNSISELRSYYKKGLLLPCENERYMKVHTLMLRRHEWPDNVNQKFLDIHKESIERERRMLESLLVKAQEEDKIRKDLSPFEVSTMITAVFHGLFIMQLSRMLPTDLSTGTDFLIDAFGRELQG